MKKLNVGVVGFGISAKVFHIPFINLLDGFQLTGIVERSGDQVAKSFPGVKTFRRFEDMIWDESIDLVVITTPNETHFPFAARCIEAGKHVVVEKPFTNSSAEARTLVEMASAAETVVSVYQNRRYVSDFLTIRNLLEKKLLGDIHEFEAHSDRYRVEAKPKAWREAPLPGSGILYDQGPHLIDQALILFGLPTAITADVRMQRPHSQVDDFFQIWLYYPSGKISLHAGMLIREPGPKFMLHGNRGSYIKSGEDVQEALLRAGISPGSPEWGKEPEAIYGLLHTEINGTVIKEKLPSFPGDYGQYYLNLYDSIVHKAPVKEKPEHGYNTVRLIELAFESSAKKCTLDCNDLMPV